MESNYLKAVLCLHDIKAKSLSENKTIFQSCLDSLTKTIKGDIVELSISINDEREAIMATLKINAI